jgi:hypothetical protein
MLIKIKSRINLINTFFSIKRIAKKQYLTDNYHNDRIKMHNSSI